MDVGLPLDFCFENDLESQLPQPLFGQIQEGRKSITAAVLSHAHLDHYGLANLLPEGIPVYFGRASHALMEIAGLVNKQKAKHFRPSYFSDRESFQVGGFTITPYLMDHSAFDAYGFLIGAAGKRLFYTGDFRGHGRKARLLDKLIRRPPRVNALLMEGTLIGERSDEITVSEDDLEKKLLQVIKTTPGMVMITLSSQNIDRVVSLFKAAKQADRRLIIDFYTAEILDRLKPYARLPQASWGRIRVCYPRFITKKFEEMGLNEILDRHRSNGVKWVRLNEIKDKVVMLIRPGFLWDIKKHLDLKGATWIYSMWPGYFNRSPALKRMRDYLKNQNVKYEYLHTTGHAKLSDLKRLAEAMAPEVIIPIHSFHPDQFKTYFPNVKELQNGENLTL